MDGAVQVGDLEIGRVVEAEGPLRPALEMLLGLTPERLDENRDWLRRVRGLNEKDVLLLAFQSFVVRTPHHTILVDTCIGNHKERVGFFPSWHRKDDTRFHDGLAALGIGVEQVDYVLCTHMHVDHVGWNTRLEDGRWVPTFPNARYVFGQDEYAYWEEQNRKAPVQVFRDSVLPIVEAGRAEMVGNEHAIGDHVRLTPTPGHTPGHVSVRLGRQDEAVVSGDLVHSPLQARYPEMSVAFDVDPAQSASTRRAFFERYAETDTVCCMTHFPSPSIGRIRRWGEGFRCEALDDTE